MAYNQRKLESHAENLKSLAWIGAIVRGIGAAIGYALFHQASVYFRAFVATLTANFTHHPTAIVVDDPNVVLTYMAVWGVIGFCSGLGNIQTRTYEANMILCQVEQEKHLRFLASVAANRE